MSLSDLITRESSDYGFRGVNRGAQVTGVVCASLALPWIAVTLRFYVRIKIQKFFGPEDWLTVASMVIFTSLCALLLRSLTYGLGAHIYNIDSDYLKVLAKYVFSCELLYVVTTAITKVSIGVYFLRLANKRYQFWIIYSVMAVVLLVSTAYFLFILFQCRPLTYFWSMYTGDDGVCLSRLVRANATYAHAAILAITDWAFGILPIAFVWSMKLDPRTKLSVVLILSLGFFASTATLVRIWYIHELSATTDYTWEGINLAKWSIVEPAIAITAAAFATLRPLFQKAFSGPRAFSSCLENSQAPSGKSSEGTSSEDVSRSPEEEISDKFAAMLGLSDKYGVRTYVYAGKKIVMKNDSSRRKAWIGDLDHTDSVDDSMEISTLSNREQLLDWGSVYTKTTITQTHSS